MADYKHRASPRTKTKAASGSGGLWFFGGFITGAFVMGLVWLKLGPELAAGRVPGLSPESPESAQTTEMERKPVPKPEFQFYTILPEMEVAIPDEEILPPRPAKAQPEPAKPREPKATAAEAATAAATAASNENYVLQMGSFRKFVDADRMKARLALIGIQAEIQKVSINNKDTFHRVRSGPYASQSSLNRVRKLAKDNGISALVIRLKG